MNPPPRSDSPTALSNHDHGLLVRWGSRDNLLRRRRRRSGRARARVCVRIRLGSRSRSRFNLSSNDSVLVLDSGFSFPRSLGRRRCCCCCCDFLPRRIVQIQRFLVPRNGSEGGDPCGRVVRVVTLWDWRTTREGLTGEKRDGESAGGTDRDDGVGTVPRSKRQVRDV